MPGLNTDSFFSRYAGQNQMANQTLSMMGGNRRRHTSAKKDEDDSKTLGGALMAAAGGAAAGSVFGPYGTAGGAGVGFISYMGS